MSNDTKSQRPSLRHYWLVFWLGVAAICFFGRPHSPASLASLESSVSSSGLNAASHKNTPRTKPISELRVGDRVLAHNPEIDNEQRRLWQEPDWRGWRKISLTLDKPNGDSIEIELLRSDEWLRRAIARRKSTDPADSIHLELEELGASGSAKIRRIQPCPAIEPGRGQVVTATYHHASSEVIDLVVAGDSGERRSIGTTTNHPIWSIDRNEFVEAGSLKTGERLVTQEGETKHVVSLRVRPNATPVYNLEVYGEHVYYVGLWGVLVHNKYDTKEAPHTTGIYHIEGKDSEGNHRVYTGQAVDFHNRLNQSDHPAREAGLFDDPDVKVTLREVDPGEVEKENGEVNTRLRGHILRYYEQTVMDENGNMAQKEADKKGVETNSVNKPRAAAEKKMEQYEKEATEAGSTISEPKVFQ